MRPCGLDIPSIHDWFELLDRHLSRHGPFRATVCVRLAVGVAFGIDSASLVDIAVWMALVD